MSIIGRVPVAFCLGQEGHGQFPGHDLRLAFEQFSTRQIGFGLRVNAEFVQGSVG